MLQCNTMNSGICIMFCKAVYFDVAYTVELNVVLNLSCFVEFDTSQLVTTPPIQAGSKRGFWKEFLVDAERCC